MHPIKSVLIKIKIKKIDAELKNLKPGSEKNKLRKKRHDLYNDLILWALADALNAKTQKKRDEYNKKQDDLIVLRGGIEI